MTDEETKTEETPEKPEPTAENAEDGAPASE